MIKILFLVPYPVGCAPSQRYRFEQYFKILANNEFICHTAPFIDEKTWRVLYRRGHYIQKIWGFFTALVRRLLLLFKIKQYHWIFVHREALLLMPSIYEWILVKIFGKKIIYDFDDAIWIPQTSKDNYFPRFFKNSSKTSTLCRLCEKITVGNEYLADYARVYNHKVNIIPTTIDTQGRHCQIKIHTSVKMLTVGWTGSHSTVPYLKQIQPVIEKLQIKYPVKFLIIADDMPGPDIGSFTFKRFCIDTEIEDLLDMDIGLMPLPDTEWAKGKCGLKALQYMALGIPAVVSPVGVNMEIVDHEVNGFFCKTEQDWYRNIEKLLINTKLREQMGQHGRKKVEGLYSVKAQSSNFLSLFRDN